MTKAATRIRLVWLTLLAFGVQLAVAGFHHHPDHRTSIADRAVTAGLCAPLRAGEPPRPCAPAQHQHDNCLLCWATALAASSLAPSVPELPAPSAIVATRLVRFEAPLANHVHSDVFEARGPPLSVSA